MNFASVAMKGNYFNIVKNIYDKYNLLEFDLNKLYENENENKLYEDSICDELIVVAYIYYQMNSIILKNIYYHFGVYVNYYGNIVISN